MNAPLFRALMFAARIRNLGKLPQNRVQKPAEPYAFAFTVLADAIHAVVPIAGAHQRQAVRTKTEAAIQGSRAMLEQRRASLRNARLKIRFFLAFRQFITL